MERRQTYLSAIGAIALLAGAVLFGACPDTDDPNPGTTDKVDSVTILLDGSPVTTQLTKEPGDTVIFTANVEVTGNVERFLYGQI